MRSVCAVPGVARAASATRTAFHSFRTRSTTSWLNASLLTLIRRRHETRTRAAVYREFLIVWMISFAMTNLLWEWPWFLSSKFIFHDLHTIGDWIGLGDRLRAHMWLSAARLLRCARVYGRAARDLGSPAKFRAPW